MATPVVIVASGGLPVVESDRGFPATIADNGFGIPITYARSGTPISTATPISILGLKVLAWWTADRADLITRSGSQMTSWKDAVAGYDCVQAVSGARPLWSATSFNGAPAATFDASDDEMTLTGVPGSFPTGAASGEIWGILQQDALPADGSARRLLSYGGVTNNDSRYATRTAVSGVNRGGITAGNGAAAIAAADVIVNYSSRHVQRSVVTGSQIRLSVDNGAMTADVACVPATGTTLVRLGASTSGIGFWNGKIRDIIVTSILTTDEAAALMAWALPRRML